jgi:hypothetical protein
VTSLVRIVAANLSLGTQLEAAGPEHRYIFFSAKTAITFIRSRALICRCHFDLLATSQEKTLTQSPQHDIAWVFWPKADLPFRHGKDMPTANNDTYYMSAVALISGDVRYWPKADIRCCSA